MASHKSVYNESNGFWMKMGRVERELGCSVVWVAKGETVRNMTPLEIYEAMNREAAERAKFEDPLANAELHGFHRTPRASMEHRLIRAAYGFASGQLGY